MEREHFPWDVFISYRRVGPDEKWVETQLVPTLESAGLRVWLDKRNSGPGSRLYRATERAIDDSRQAICVVSPPYMRKVRKGGGLLFLELRRLLDSNTAEKYARLIPLLLGDGQVPEMFGGLVAIDWTNPDTHPREWKKLLGELRAKNPEAPAPGAIELYFLQLYLYLLKDYFKRALPAACVLLVIVVLGWWLISSEGAARQDGPPRPAPTLQLVEHPPLPTPTPAPRGGPGTLPRATIQEVGGTVVGNDMEVSPSAVVAGVVEGEVAPGSRVFVYVQRKGGDYDDLWLCAGTAAPEGKTWSFGRVEFRLPEFEGETRATVLTLLRSQQVCGEFKESELSEIVGSSAGAPSRLSVTVPRPQVSVGNARLDRTQNFTASGTADNLLEGEGLCVNLKVVRGARELISKCFHTTVSGKSWMVSEGVGIEVRAGDSYTVEVSLAPKGSTGDTRPEGFTVLVRSIRSV